MQGKREHTLHTSIIYLTYRYMSEVNKEVLWALKGWRGQGALIAARRGEGGSVWWGVDGYNDKQCWQGNGRVVAWA